MKSINRAIIIGEKTTGNTNNAPKKINLSDEIYLEIPTIINKNPYTKTDWSGGIIPDIILKNTKLDNVIKKVSNIIKSEQINNINL